MKKKQIDPAVGVAVRWVAHGEVDRVLLYRQTDWVTGWLSDWVSWWLADCLSA